MPQVLIVDDDPATRWMIADDLRDRGFEIAEAENGTDALAYLDHSRPDVIVLDLMMQGGDGWSFLETYHTKTDGVPIPTVVVSAARALPISYEGRGVRQFLPKPFTIDDLATWVGRLTNAAAATAPAGA